MIAIAPVQKRIIAFAIDLIIFLALFSIIYFIFFFQYESFSSEFGAGFFYGIVVPTSSAYIIVLVSWIAFITLTEFSSGQSFGKRIAKIKVVKNDLTKPTFFNIFIRHLFDIIDFTLFIGLIVALTNKNGQRIGDMVAKTKVVTI